MVEEALSDKSHEDLSKNDVGANDAKQHLDVTRTVEEALSNNDDDDDDDDDDEDAPIEGDLTLNNFREGGSSGCYDRASRSQWAVVDARLHSHPFGGAAVPFKEVTDWLRRAGVLFATLNGIGQRLPIRSDGIPTYPCTYYLDCPGQQLTPSIANDVINAENVLDANASFGTSAGPHIVLSMTFPNLAEPETVLPRMMELNQEYPHMFTCVGEVNVAKQALNRNSAGVPYAPVCAVRTDYVYRVLCTLRILYMRTVLCITVFCAVVCRFGVPPQSYRSNL